jgi:hypothetical protein
LQKYNQRFMREVKYVRPPGFVDRFAEPPASTSPSTGRRKNQENAEDDESKSPGGRDSNSSAHVHRIRNMRQERSSSTLSRDNSSMHRRSRDPGHQGHSTGGDGRTPRQHHRGHHGEGGEEGAGGYYDGDAFEDEDDYGAEDEEEFRELLAEAHRDVRVSEEVVHHHHHHQSQQPRHRNAQQHALTTSEVKLHVYLASAEVRCWLVNSELIVLSAVVHEEGRLLEAEAELSLEDLAVLRGEDPSLLGGGSTASSVVHREGDGAHHHDGASSVLSLGFDMHTLQQVAQEMVAHVELRVDAESGARLILNLVSDEDSLLLDGDGDLSVGTAEGHKGHGSAPAAGTHHAHSSTQRPDVGNESLMSEEELGGMLIDGNIRCYFEAVAVCVLNHSAVVWLTDDRQVVMTMGTRVPVHFENQVITASVANLGTLIDAAKIKNRNESVYALVKVVSTEEDQVTNSSAAVLLCWLC